MKAIYDCKHVKGVSAICLLKDGKEAGKIICNWSDNPVGTVCTAAVILYNVDGKGKAWYGIGKAGGYGYDKKSAAIYDALHHCKDDGTCPLSIGVRSGAGNERAAFESAGFTYIEII